MSKLIKNWLINLLDDFFQKMEYYNFRSLIVLIKRCKKCCTLFLQIIRLCGTLYFFAPTNFSWTCENPKSVYNSVKIVELEGGKGRLHDGETRWRKENRSRHPLDRSLNLVRRVLPTGEERTNRRWHNERRGRGRTGIGRGSRWNVATRRKGQCRDFRLADVQIGDTSIRDHEWEDLVNVLLPWFDSRERARLEPNPPVAFAPAAKPNRRSRSRNRGIMPTFWSRGYFNDLRTFQRV